MKVERVTITIDAELLAFVDALSASKGYGSRSEAIRDILRQAARTETQADPAAPCFATLAYVFDHETRDLARRLTNQQHDHHDLSVATLHVHLDRHECLEVSVLRGESGAVRAFADEVISQRGVRHGQLHLLPGAPAGRHHHHHPDEG
ncbi:DNA-binding transcriptional repressor NikR [Hyphomicrobiales bacterium]|nr:DNA-binding transcriptional repressor NikR [Hyphomicrobiales bacterium]CAH1698856.1 DNA-binding transcriptional repressor NikR [Hyphomicrobiales bacterium]CAI0342500.1 DNA-binding transcriptional repressor NikR [Hyphomicrobiales bacterium]